MPMGCNCCTERPCCGNRLFRGPGSVDPLTLSLESRQTWTAVGTSTTCPAVYPYGNNPTGTDPTRILTSHDLTMTYETPISSDLLSVHSEQQWYDTPPTVSQNEFGICEFQPEYATAWPFGHFFEPSEGWYVSGSVGLYEVPGDAVWSGDLFPETGRYFLARMYKWVIPPETCDSGLIQKQFSRCVLGFLLDSLGGAGLTLYGEYEVPFFRIKDGVFESGSKAEYLYHADNNFYPTRGWDVIRTSGGDVSAILFDGLNPINTLNCNPLLGEQNGPSLSEDGCGISGPFHPTGLATKTGLYASPFRNRSLTIGLGGRGDLPTVDDTPPVSIAALTSTHIVSEIFHMHYTISE